MQINENKKNTFKLSDYGVPPQLEQSILLLTSTELVAITDILRNLTTDADILKKIDELEKPFKQNLNKEQTK